LEVEVGLIVHGEVVNTVQEDELISALIHSKGLGLGELLEVCVD
jgi:hypothetical protein